MRVDDRRALRAIVEALPLFGECIEEPADCGSLLFARLESVDFAPKRVAAREVLRVPPEVLARDPYASRLSVEGVVVREVQQDFRARLRDRRRGQMASCLEVVLDLAENP